MWCFAEVSVRQSSDTPQSASVTKWRCFFAPHVYKYIYIYILSLQKRVAPGPPDMSMFRWKTMCFAMIYVHNVQNICVLRWFVCKCTYNNSTCYGQSTAKQTKPQQPTFLDMVHGGMVAETLFFLCFCVFSLVFATFLELAFGLFGFFVFGLVFGCLRK